ncbi:MAG: hypothetical protein QM662_02740 [Gordonia sp. (in: high G+C Gram-positive bacteria)]
MAHQATVVSTRDGGLSLVPAGTADDGHRLIEDRDGVARLLDDNLATIASLPVEPPGSSRRTGSGASC